MRPLLRPKIPPPALRSPLLRVIGWSLVCAWFVGGFAYLGLRYYAWPRIDQWRPQITAELATLLGRPVSIGAIESGFEGWLPRLTVTDVLVADDAGEPLLSVPKATAVLSPATLAAARIRLSVLQVESPRVRVERVSERLLRVAGVDVPLDGPSDGSGLEVLAGQRRILLLDAAIDWIDHLRGEQIAIRSVDLALGSVGRRHRAVVAIGAIAPMWERLHLAFEFYRPPNTPIGDWRNWSGELFGGASGLDLREVRSALPQLVTGPVSGLRGDLRVWASFDHGRPQDVLVRAAARDLQLDPQDPPLLASAEFEARMRTAGDGYDLRVAQLSARDPSGFALTALGEQQVALDAAGAPVRGRVSLQGFDPAAALEFAKRLPLAPDTLQRLRALRASGRIASVSARWAGGPEPEFEAAVDFEGLSLRHLPDGAERPGQAGVPWFGNLSGEARVTQSDGQLRVRAERAVLVFPGVFDEPTLPFDRLDATARWRLEPGDEGRGLSVSVDELRFSNSDAAGTVSGTYRTGGKGPGIVDLEGRLERADATRVARYLPLTIASTVREWVAGAVTAGRSDDVRFRLRGDLWDFPYVKPEQGEFFVDARLADAVLRYAPGWPAIERLQGSLRFERSGMQVSMRSGRVFDVALANAQAVIRDFSEPLLRVDVGGDGPAQDMVRFVNDSPLATRIDDFTQDTELRGSARLQLRLDLPLGELERTRVAGSVVFQGNDLRLDRTLPPLGGVSGVLEFTETGLALRGVSATFLGGPLRVEGETPEPGRFLLRGEGEIPAEGMRTVVDNPITRALSGRAAYRATIDVHRRAASVVVESDLEGLASALPAPLDKPAPAKWPLIVQATPMPAPGPEQRSPGDTIRVALRDGIRVVVERQREATTQKLLIRRASLGVNAQPSLRESGLSVALAMPAVDVDAWAPLLVRPEMVQAGERASTEFAEGFSLKPDVVSVVAPGVRVGGKDLHDVVFGASRADGYWRANVSAREANGYFNWREAAPGQRIGTLTARFTRLEIPRSKSSEVESLLDTPPDDLPALDVAAEEFVLNDHPLGTLSVRATNGGTPQYPVWTLEQLRIVNPHAALTAQGTWATRRGGTGRATRLDLQLDLGDSGELLALFGQKGVLRGGTGRLAGSVRWNGSPLAIDYPTLDGDLRLDVGRGQFLKADPGIAKLIGVLNLQSLPRRLTLDFRDVFAEGFAFDSIAGDVEIERGVARTDRLTMRGPAAQVNIRGSANIAAETQALEVEVRPEFNAGLAPLAYGAIVNPVLGLGAFVAQLALSRPIAQMLTYEYSVTGAWDDPVVVEKRRRAEPAPVPSP
jgi:uncharacterized protein (TIGR02099 family)